MSEVDPDPYEPGEGQGEAVLGDHEVPADGDPTEGGKHGDIGSAPSITSDEPGEAGSGYPVGGGDIDTGRDA